MMKFQKINLLLTIAILSSNMSFCPEPEPINKFTPLKNSKAYNHEDYERALKNLDQNRDNFNEKTLNEKYRKISLQHHPDVTTKDQAYYDLKKQLSELQDKWRKSIANDNTEEANSLRDQISSLEKEISVMDDKYSANSKIINESHDYAKKHLKKYKDTREEYTRQEEARQETARQEAARQEAAKQEAARQEKERKQQEYQIRLDNARKRASAAAQGTGSDDVINLGIDKENTDASGMTPNELATKLTPETVKALTPETIKAITSDPEKLKALFENKSALEALTPEQVQAITSDPEKLKAIFENKSALEALTPEQVQAITSDPEKLKAIFENKSALDALTPEQFQAIDPKTLAKFASGETLPRFSDKALSRIVKKMSPEQAKAINDAYNADSGWLKDARHLFDKEQRAAISDLAEIATKFPKNPKEVAKVIDLSYKLPDGKEEFIEKLKKLSSKKKEFVANRFIKNLDNKDINQKAQNFIDDYIKPGLQSPNEYPILIQGDKNFTSRIEIVTDMSSINPTMPIVDQINSLVSSEILSLHLDNNGKNNTVHSDLLETSYAQWFSGRIDLSKPFDAQVSELVSYPSKTAPKLEDFEDFIKFKILKELTEKVNTAFRQNPDSINPDFIKYIKTSNLSPAQVSELNLDILQKLSPEQIKVLNTSKFSDSQVKVILQRMISDKSVLLSDNQLKMLPKDTLQSALKSLKESDVTRLKDLLKNSLFEKTVSRELSKRAGSRESSASMNPQNLLVLGMKPNEIMKLTTANIVDLDPETFTKMTDDQIGYLDFDNIDINKLSNDQNIAIAKRIDSDQLKIILEKAKGDALKTFTSSASISALRSLSEEQMESVAKSEDAVVGLAENEVIVDTGLFNQVAGATEKVDTTKPFVQALPKNSLDSIVRNTGIDTEIVLTNISEEQAKGLSENARASILLNDPKLIIDSKELAEKVIPGVTNFDAVRRLLKTITEPTELANITSSLTTDQIANLPNDYFTADKLLQPEVIVSLDADQLDAFTNKIGKSDIDAIKQLLTNSSVRSNSNAKIALQSRLDILTKTPAKKASK